MDVYLKLSNSEAMLLGVLPISAVDEVYLSVTGNTELTEFFKIINKPPIHAIPVEYQQICNFLNLSGKHALQSIPKDKIANHIFHEIEKMKKALCDIEDQQYLVTYLTIKRFLLGLNRAAVDIKELKTHIQKTSYDAVKSSLRSLKPLDDHFCKKTSYSMTNSATGRLTVLDGPQILTIPAESRKCFKSKYKNGKILQIDLISAEPKFALHLSGKKPPKDVYAFITKTILENKVTRKQAKLITLCALYGQSVKKLEAQLPESVNARSVIQKTKKYFDSESLLARLRVESKKGFIRNAMGRPITIEPDNERLLISYYLQSSVAEASIVMFSEFIKNTAYKCDPLFVIHDALIIDCDESTCHELLENKNFNLLLGDWNFEAEVKEVGE